MADRSPLTQAAALLAALTLAACATVSEVRAKDPVLVVAHPKPPTAAIDCIQDEFDRRTLMLRRDARPPIERLVITSPALIGPAYFIADVAALPDGAGSRVEVRPGPQYAKSIGRVIETALKACAGPSP